MKKKLSLALFFLLCGCFRPLEITDVLRYSCDGQIIATAYYSDGSMILTYNDNRVVLHKTSGNCSVERYANIGKAVIFESEGEKASLKFGPYAYPECIRLVNY